MLFDYIALVLRLQELVLTGIIRLTTMRKQLTISISIFIFITIATIVVILYGKGYRFGLDKGRPGFLGTGLLVSTSTPDGAQVFINGHLTTATDNTISLSPGDYDVKIFKEGYIPWEKNIPIQKEVVSKADALLFPNAPKLESITTTGVQNPIIDPSGTRLAYTISSQSAREDGVYVLDMTSRPILALQATATQITDNTTDDFSNAAVTWSPNGQELLATISGELRNPSTYLLNASRFNDNPQDATATLDSVAAQWQKEKEEIDQSRLNSVKPLLKQLITADFNIISWSPDETKIFYQASASATLPFLIEPRLIGTNSTEENRDIKDGSTYIYDMKEDKNYTVDLGPLANNPFLSEKEKETSPSAYLTWFPDDKHLMFVHDKQIEILEYDGSNKTTIYAGPFDPNYVFPWPNGSKVVILTNLGNPTISANLYTIVLK